MVDIFDFDDDIKDDPKDVDTLLSSELMRLSISQRNAIQEEIHGVRCLAPEETPELLESSLRQLALELDRNLPNKITQAYQQSQKIPNTYVNTPEFRLRFLRCDLFDVKKAARRMANFLNIALDIFGEYALERPIRLSDLNREELKCMRMGCVQWLLFRDRSDRRVAVCFPSEFSAKIKAKIAMYMCWMAGDDVVTQRKGVVVLFWIDKSVKLPLRPKDNKPKFHEVLTVRICALHMCTPNGPFYQFRRAVMSMRAAYMRLQMRIHVGNMVELLYKLRDYGIPSDTLPITYSGTVKTKAIGQWMRFRAFLEQPIYQNSEETRFIIECPLTSDVIIRKGTSFRSHPGNAALRALVVSTVIEMKQKSSKEHNKLTGKVLVNCVMEEMQRKKMRLLNWIEKEGYWKIITDQSQIYQKVEYLVREHGKSTRSNKNWQCNESGTSVFSSRHNSEFDCISLELPLTTQDDAGRDGNGCWAECNGKKFNDL